MKPLKKKVSITLDEDIIEEIKELSEECDRSFSRYINLVLKNYLKKQRKNLKYRSDSFKTYQSHNVHLRNMHTSYTPDCAVFGNLSVDSGRIIGY